MASFDLIGVGSPIMDLLARVPDEFLRSHVAGDKGGMVLVDADEMARILSFSKQYWINRHMAKVRAGTAVLLDQPESQKTIQQQEEDV